MGQSLNNFTQLLTNQPTLFAVYIIAIISALLVLAIYSIPYFIKQNKIYNSPFDFASRSSKVITVSALVCFIGLGIYGFMPYVPPASDEIAIVLGNTQNTPAPSISGEISEAIEGTMLRHKGDDVDELADSIKIISAIKNPEVISLDPAELKLQEIGNNNSNAKRSAKLNVQAIEQKINNLPPTDNGANYLEAILEARDNVEEGSLIIVIGSGLSDEGDLNFSKSNLLTNEQSRKDALKEIKEKYGYDYLDGYSIEFYGLGDTVAPQENLSNIQKDVARTFYKEMIRGLGGDVNAYTKTMIGDSVTTDYVVGTTDTGCGEIGLIFSDENLKFVSNKATFTDEQAANESLMTIKRLWDNNKDTIQSIQVEGYIAHYPGPDNLSQPRSDLVKAALINLGIPSEKINAVGRGYGPHKEDSKNRMVKVTISRDSDQCQN